MADETKAEETEADETEAAEAVAAAMEHHAESRESAPFEEDLLPRRGRRNRPRADVGRSERLAKGRASPTTISATSISDGGGPALTRPKAALEANAVHH